MKRQRNLSQIKEECKTSEKELNKMERSNLSYKVFKVIVIIMLTKHRRRMDELSENCNKNIKNIKMDQLKLKNTITEMKNILEGNNSRS